MEPGSIQPSSNATAGTLPLARNNGGQCSEVFRCARLIEAPHEFLFEPSFAASNRPFVGMAVGASQRTLALPGIVLSCTDGGNGFGLNGKDSVSTVLARFVANVDARKQKST